MKQPVKTHKTLIALLYWEGDKAQANALAKLLADLEPEHSQNADFLFVCRFDCKHDMPTVNYVARKFNVYTHTSKRRGTGWPMGCNSLFFGTLEWVYYKMASAQVPHYKNVLILGSDGAPLRRNWLEIFSAGWESVSAKSKVFMAGALIKQPDRNHINGDCALLSGDLDFLRWLTLDVGDISVTAGWDWVLAGDFERRGWADFPFVKSVWNRREEFTQQDWDTEVAAGTVWFHGQKKGSLLAKARANLLP